MLDEKHMLKTSMTTFLAMISITMFITTSAVPEENSDDTYDQETVVEAATEALGDGAKGAAKAIESLFKKYGRPNAYIAGSEAGAGLIIGVRYGGGTLMHKIEGQRNIHWTGPSIGLDAGADAVKSFALVYNLYDTEEIYRRITAVEGSFYYVGGAGVSVYTHNDIVIAMVRLGVGLRAQATLGYINFTKEKKLIPL